MYVRSQSSADRQNHLCANCSSALTPCSPLLALLMIAADRPRSTTSRAGNLVNDKFPRRSARYFNCNGGEGGIRTPDTVARMPHFECGAFNHSATSPGSARLLSDGRLERLQERRFISRVLGHCNSRATVAAPAGASLRYARRSRCYSGPGPTVQADRASKYKRPVASGLRGGSAQEGDSRNGRGQLVRLPVGSEDWCAAAPSLRWPCNLHRT